MQFSDGVEFCCGTCAWMQVVKVPEGKEKDYPIPRGYCTSLPPKVFPMPQPKKTSIAALGTKPEMEMVPLMLRPVVDANEPPCSLFTPNNETLELIKKLAPDKKCDNSCTTEQPNGSE